MLVSILIATRNRSSALAETLRALDQVDILGDLTAEIVVVDNGSTDDTRSMVKSFQPRRMQLRCGTELRPGKAGALNTGLNLSAGELVVLTDDDVRPEPQWLVKITQPIRDGKCAAVAGAVRIAPHLVRPWMTATHRAWLASTEYLDARTPEAALGANMAFSRAVLADVPGFDSELGPGRLGFWEDTLFSQQLVKAGHRLAYAPKAVVEHHFEPNRLLRASFLSRARSEGRSSAYVAWHWRHECRARVRSQLAYYRVLLAAKRIARPSDWRRAEGMPEWEMNLLGGIAFNQHFLEERRQSPKYEQFGCRKRS